MDTYRRIPWIPSCLICRTYQARGCRGRTKEYFLDPTSDILNLISLVVLVGGVFVLPVLGFDDKRLLTYAFGLGMLLFVGYPFGLAGHYELYNKKQRTFRYFPCQEKIAIAVITALAITYVIIASSNIFKYSHEILISVT